MASRKDSITSVLPGDVLMYDRLEAVTLIVSVTDASVTLYSCDRCNLASLESIPMSLDVKCTLVYFHYASRLIRDGVSYNVRSLHGGGPTIVETESEFLPEKWYD